MQTFQLLIVVLGASAGVFAGKGDHCPWVLGKHPFHEEKAAGVWNVIASTTYLNLKPPKCGRMQVDVGKDKLSLKYSGLLPNETSIDLEMVAQPVFDHMEHGFASYYVVVKKGDSYIGPYEHGVVSTDYDNYAVVITCRTIFNEQTKSFGRDLSAKILARGKSLDAATLKVLKNILIDYDVKPESIYDVEQCA